MGFRGRTDFSFLSRRYFKLLEILYVGMNNLLLFVHILWYVPMLVVAARTPFSKVHDCKSIYTPFTSKQYSSFLFFENFKLVFKF